MHLSRCIHTLRFLSFFISLVAFFCHLSQCLLLNNYKEKTGISGWLTAGHWQYLAWYISLALSMAGGLVVCINAAYFRTSTKYSLDKCVGSLVLIPILASTILASLMNPAEPWINGRFDLQRPSNSFLIFCNRLDASKDEFYPLLYQRCMLNDSTWILAILVCIIWACLVGFVMFESRKKKAVMAENIIRLAAKEPKWGRYIPDPPSSIYSATTLGNRSGLLTPSSTLTRENHRQFYYNCNIPRLPASPVCDYYSDSKEKGYPDYYPITSKEGYKLPDAKSNDDKITAISAYEYFTRGDYYNNDRKSPSSYHNGGGNQKEGNNSHPRSSSPYSSRQSLTVSTSYRGNTSPPSSSSEKEPESATTITTPLYSKFSSSNMKTEDTFSFGVSSFNNLYTSFR